MRGEVAAELVAAMTDVGAVLDAVRSLSMSMVLIKKTIFGDHDTGGGNDGT